MSNQKPYTCFLIGQMTDDEDMKRLYNVRDELLKPILEPLGYAILTPDDVGGSEDVMRFVLKMLDTAELVVADLTKDNPNVYYELSIRHSLGLPYALISSTGTRFDISQLRFVKYDPNDLDHPDMRAKLEKMLTERHQQVVNKSDSDNPISNFYGAPLAEVSPASGLGLGYYRNFIQTTMRDIVEDESKINVHDVDMTAAVQAKPRLQIWIPNHIRGADRKNIGTLLTQTGKLLPAQIVAKRAPRPFPLYALPDTSSGVTLVDVPTAMIAMEVAITGRYSGMRIDKGSTEWRKLEVEEIDRFRDTIKRYLRNEDEEIIRRGVTLHDWDLEGE